MFLGSAQCADLRRARPEVNGVGIVAGIKPKEATALRRSSVAPAKHGVLAAATGAQAARARARLVLAVIVQGQWEAPVESKDWADRPTTRHGVCSAAHIAAEFLTLAEWQFIDDIGSYVSSQ